MKKTCLILLFSCSYFLTTAQLEIFFRPGKTLITDSSAVKLKEQFSNKQIKYKRVILEGNADNRGSHPINDIVSRKRCVAVQSLLENFGVPPGVITIVVNGKRKPIASNRTPAGRTFNRRVDVIVEEEPIVAAIPLAVEEDQGNIADLYRLLKDEGQSFCIRPDRDTAIIGKYGSIVYYKANTFEGVDCSCIRIVLHEYFKKSEMVLNNLTTTSDGQPLESGGMTKLEGYCGDNLLQFRDNKYLLVMTPTASILPGMKLFSANRHDPSEILDWQAENTELIFVDWDNMMWRCSFRTGGTAAKCPFFFCRIKYFFQNLFSGRSQVSKQPSQEDLLLDQFSLSEQIVSSAFVKSKESNDQVKKYYVYRNNNWGYHNIDRFIANQPVSNFAVNEQPQQNTDIRLSFKQYKTVIPSQARTKDYFFPLVIDKQECYALGLRYKKNEVFLALEKTNTAAKSCNVSFRKVTVDELKTALQILD